MASVNKVILLGNCGRDPEIRYLPSGQAVANISIATSTRRKDKNTGESIEDTQWHRVTFYDRLAEIVGEYVRRGQPIYVEGRLKYGKYIDQAGVEKNTVDIVATELQLLGKREGMGGNGGDEGGGGGGGGGSAYGGGNAGGGSYSAGGGGGGGGYSRPAPAARPAAPPPMQRPAPPPAQAQPQSQSQPRPASSFNDMDDDIPF